MTSLSNISDHEKAVACIVCGGMTRPRFRKPYLDALVVYNECRECGHLTSTEFKSGTDYSDRKYFVDIDYGWEPRNAKILEVWKFLTMLPGLGLNRRSTVLDYGCGKGRLVNTLSASGFEAHGYDPFVDDLESKRVYSDITEVRRVLNGIDAITLVEVIEHMRAPGDLLKQISDLLIPGGYLLISTGIFEMHNHDETWYYLIPEAGHVSIFSWRSLVKIMDANNFVPVIRVNETIALFRKRNGFLLSRLVDNVYYIFSSLRVALKPSNLFRRNIRK